LHLEAEALIKPNCGDVLSLYCQLHGSESSVLQPFDTSPEQVLRKPQPLPLRVYYDTVYKASACPLKITDVAVAYYVIGSL